MLFRSLCAVFALLSPAEAVGLIVFPDHICHDGFHAPVPFSAAPPEHLPLRFKESPPVLKLQLPYDPTEKPGGGAIYLYPQQLGGRSRQISKFKASCVYKASFRTSRATQRNPVSKNQNPKQNKVKEIILNCLLSLKTKAA